METVFGQTLALRLEKRDEHHPQESNTTGQKMSRGTFTFTFTYRLSVICLDEPILVIGLWEYPGFIVPMIRSQDDTVGGVSDWDSGYLDLNNCWGMEFTG